MAEVINGILIREVETKDIMNEDSIYYFCHDLCTSNTLLNSSGIS